jgi:hypothetical protein
MIAFTDVRWITVFVTPGVGPPSTDGTPDEVKSGLSLMHIAPT